MVVTVAQVRTQLNNISTTMLSDSVIQQQIDTASRQVNNLKSKDAPDALVDDAVLMLASYQSYLAYIEMIARDIGRFPEGADAELRRLKELADTYISVVVPKRDVPISVGKLTMTLEEAEN